MLYPKKWGLSLGYRLGQAELAVETFETPAEALFKGPINFAARDVAGQGICTSLPTPSVLSD